MGRSHIGSAGIGACWVACILLLAACGQEQPEPLPPPAAVTSDAVAYFCGMGVAEHPGPKGQIWLAGKSAPLWFAQVRDAVAFTLLPEEPKDIRAIWVSDMARSSSWDRPQSWVEARQAFFVVGSDRMGGMGLPETVPFSDRAAAEVFAHHHGGRVMRFDNIPPAAILGG